MCSTGAWAIPGMLVREIADPASTGATERYFDDIIGSVNAGYGVVDNIMVPPSKLSSRARGENVGYSGVSSTTTGSSPATTWRVREILVVDSGFAPNIYWQSVDQAATCVAGKGYTACPIGAPAPTGGAGRCDGRGAVEAMGASMSVARYRELLPAFVESMRLAQITTHCGPLTGARRSGTSRPVCGTQPSCEVRRPPSVGMRVALIWATPSLVTGSGSVGTGGCRSPAAITTPRCRCGRSPSVW